MVLLNPEIVALYSTPNSTAFTGCRTILLQILTKIPDKGFQDPQSLKTDVLTKEETEPQAVMRRKQIEAFNTERKRHL